MFNKKDEERKLKKEEKENLRLDIEERNTKIVDHDKQLDKDRRRLDDRNLLNKQQEITMQLQ